MQFCGRFLWRDLHQAEMVVLPIHRNASGVCRTRRHRRP